MDIERAISDLTAVLKNTAEYKNLISARAVVKSNAKLSSLIDELEKRQNYLYSNNLSENEAMRISQELRSEYEKLYQIKEAKNYFDASEQFDKLMGSTISKIAANLR